MRFCSHSPQLSGLLQTPNIEAHTALYWAIVNHRQEVFSAFARFISKFSSECSSDLHFACMQISDHALFSQLNLQNSDAKSESLRRFLGCPPGEIEVHEGGELDDHQFVASFHIGMSQKCLRATQELKQEFVAQGRIWWIRFYMGTSWRWRVGCGLSSPSLPACPKSSLLLGTHTRQGEPGRETPPKVLVRTEFLETVVPDEPKRYIGDVGKALIAWSSLLGDWVTYELRWDLTCEAGNNTQKALACYNIYSLQNGGD
ncbi:uncharacterized protein BJ212DRAFT_1591963 [Suillus subaureus]|uniref:Uncharacterized protein n=1 Tax=Suillus subaureus TaxID=48587 RepID=A0A9P7DL87_9AGAM|nr:uncharacterized protein BJ212DRAFT_1591963 [Suillus subaureus]KAG1797566.1 hypothetical protein BJ212DRAFT_1591963 [Suillus subaureus]